MLVSAHGRDTPRRCVSPKRCWRRWGSQPGRWRRKAKHVLVLLAHHLVDLRRECKRDPDEQQGYGEYDGTHSDHNHLGLLVPPAFLVLLGLFLGLAGLVLLPLLLALPLVLPPLLLLGPDALRLGRGHGLAVRREVILDDQPGLAPAHGQVLGLRRPVVVAVVSPVVLVVSPWLAVASRQVAFVEDGRRLLSGPGREVIVHVGYPVAAHHHLTVGDDDPTLVFTGRKRLFILGRRPDFNGEAVLRAGSHCDRGWRMLARRPVTSSHVVLLGNVMNRGSSCQKALRFPATRRLRTWQSWQCEVDSDVSGVALQSFAFGSMVVDGH